MYILGRGKIGYLTGEKKEHALEDPDYSTLDAENSMLMTRLVNSMKEGVSSNYMCYHTAKELLDNINLMYSDLGNQLHVFELKLKLRGSASVYEAETARFSTKQLDHILKLLKYNFGLLIAPNASWHIQVVILIP